MARVFDSALPGAGLLVLVALGCGGRTPAEAPASPVPGASVPSSPAAGASPATPHPALGRSTITSRGKTPWKLEAERVDYDDQRKAARVGRLTWSLVDEKGRSRVRVEGDGALVDIDREKVTFEGPVVAYGPKGEVLHVQHLVWDGNKESFYGSQGVRLERETTVVTGERMVASPDLGKMSLEGKVQARLRGVAP